MANILNSTTNFVKDGVDQGVKGVSSVGKTGAEGIGKIGNAGADGVGTVGKGVGDTFNPSKEKHETQPQSGSDPTQTVTDAIPDQSSLENPTESMNNESQKPQKSGGLGGFFQSTGSILTSGASQVINPAVEASKAGAGFLQSVSSTGFDLGKSVASTGVNATTNVIAGTVDLAGTAVGGVITAAADTSGKVFEPVAAGLKSIKGLEGLGEGLEKVNGLPMQAIKEVGNMTMKALNMSGVTPTFFDTDGDGIVTMSDTIKGLMVLGLEEQYANYGAYALHGVFSYPTSDSWLPSTDKNLPIHINKMSNTRWGKNWGTFERMDWCDDMDINTFFDTTSADPDADSQTRFQRWQETFKKSRQYFGVLLLIFEWGTTWPFVFPPNVPVEAIPFKDEIGGIVRKVILPTVFANYQRSRGESGNAAPAKAQPPSENMPQDSKDA